VVVVADRGVRAAALEVRFDGGEGYDRLIGPDVDADWRITWFNNAAVRLLGLAGNRDLGQPVTSLLRAPAFEYQYDELIFYVLLGLLCGCGIATFSVGIGQVAPAGMGRAGRGVDRAALDRGAGIGLSRQGHRGGVAPERAAAVEHVLVADEIRQGQGLRRRSRPGAPAGTAAATRTARRPDPKSQFEPHRAAPKPDIEATLARLC